MSCHSYFLSQWGWLSIFCTQAKVNHACLNNFYYVRDVFSLGIGSFKSADRFASPGRNPRSCWRGMRKDGDAKSPSVKFVLLCLWREGRQSQVLVSSQRARIHARFDLPSQKYAPASSWIDPEDFTTAGASSSTSLNTHHLLSFIVWVLKNSLSVARYKSGLQLTVTFSCAFLTLFEQCRVNYVWGLLHHRFSSNSHFWLLIMFYYTVTSHYKSLFVSWVSWSLYDLQ